MGIGPGPQNRFAIQFVDGCFNQTSENLVGYVSLALEPNTNAVNLSYFDACLQDLRYAYKQDSSDIWHTMSIDGSGTNVGLFASLAMDNSGNRHISYHDFDISGLKYAYGPSGPNDISWQIYKVDTSGNKGKYTSLAVDNEGNRHISYFDDASNEGLKYAYGPAGTGDISWQIYKVDYSGDTGQLASLALDNEGNRHISYLDGTNFGLKYAFGPAGNSDISWQIYKVDSSGDTGLFSSLALDNSGNRHISYLDGSNFDLKYAFRPAGNSDISWQIYNVDQSGFVGVYTSIAIHPNTQKPSISYFKVYDLSTNSAELRIAKQILDTTWEIGVLDISVNVGTNSGSYFKFDINGDEHLSFTDSDNLLGQGFGRVTYALNPAGQYGDACPLFTTLGTFDVSKVEKPASFVTNPTDFSLNLRSPTEQRPFDLSTTIVPPCPPE
jgi:hypothetical protein